MVHFCFIFGYKKTVVNPYWRSTWRNSWGKYGFAKLKGNDNIIMKICKRSDENFQWFDSSDGFDFSVTKPRTEIKISPIKPSSNSLVFLSVKKKICIIIQRC